MSDHGISIGKTSLREYALARCALLAIVGAFVCPSGGKSFAAPITFAFDATVTDVPADVGSLNLPVTIEVGQKINGKYQFNSSQDLLYVVTQPGFGGGLVSLAIEGAEVTAPINRGSIGSGNTFNPPIAGVPASINLSYLSPTDVEPPWNGNFFGQRWNTNLWLTGPQEAISNVNQVLDIDTWNLLTTTRRLDLQFAYRLMSQYEFVTISTVIGDFREIPEPSVCVCTLALSLGAIQFTRRLTRRPLSVGTIVC